MASVIVVPIVSTLFVHQTRLGTTNQEAYQVLSRLFYNNLFDDSIFIAIIESYRIEYLILLESFWSSGSPSNE